LLIKKLREDLGFLTKEKSYGNLSFSELPFQDSNQNTTVFPLLGMQTEMDLNFSKSFKISFHQKEPQGLLTCGGVC